MRSVIFLVVLLLFGCISQQDLQKTTEECPVSGQEIQEICSIRIEKIDLEYCKYMIDDHNGITMGAGERTRTIEEIANTQSAVLSDEEYEILDEWNESVYTSFMDDWKPTLLNPPRRVSEITILSGDMQYHVSASNPGDEYDGCTSKEDLIKLTKLYYERK